MLKIFAMNKTAWYAWMLLKDHENVESLILFTKLLAKNVNNWVWKLTTLEKQVSTDIQEDWNHAENYRSTNKNTQEKSALRIHAKNVHQDKKVAYKMEVIQAFKKPLARQVMESIYIIKSKAEDDFPMNSKNEFNQALIVTAKYTKGCH